MRLVMVPGLAANALLFSEQAQAFPQLEIVTWIPPKRRETLPGYAERLAGTVAGNGEMVLGGVSLGGMLALEMAKHLKPRGVVMIASCQHPCAIKGVLRVAARAGSWMPGWAAERARVPIALSTGWMLGPVGFKEKRALVKMARVAPTYLALWGLRAIVDWKGVKDAGAPVHTIHGDADRIIPVERVDADHVVRGAGHLVNMTHAAEVNAVIERVLRS